MPAALSTLPSRLRAAAQAHPDAFDVLIALVLAVATLATLLPSTPDPDVSVADGVTWPGVPLALAMTLPVAVRRRWPLAVLLVTGAAVIATGLLGFSSGPGALGLVLALATASFYRGRTTTVVASIVGVGLLLGVYLAIPALGRDDAAMTSMVFSTLTVVLALVTGDVLRGHRQALAALAERNRRLEALRDVERREAVAQDRVRIAREVHDIVGHALAAITLQARAGRRQVERDPGQAQATFGQIEEVAARALEETRQAVGVIRSGAEREALRPQPRLDDLPALVAAVTAEHLQVTLRCDADDALPATVQASAYRIVQESLANVVKHANARTTTVELTAEAGGVRLRVQDDGRGANGSAGSEGSGLAGMRARAAQVGGTLTAGAVDGGGWRVEAWLPNPGART